MGTAFLASDESIAVAKHKEAVVNSAADDVLLTSIVTGIPGSFLRSGLAEAGLLDQLGKMPPPAKVDFTKWRNVWSAGQAVGHVSEITNVAAIVARIEKEYLAQSVGDGIGEDGVLAALNGEKNDDIL
jgi:nitronate monooxygenase